MKIKLLKSLRKWFSILVREWRSCFFRVTQRTMGSLICHWNCIILVWNGHFDVGIDLVVVVRTMKLSKRHKNIWLWNLHYAKCLFEMGRLSCSYLRLLYKCILRFDVQTLNYYYQIDFHVTVTISYQYDAIPIIDQRFESCLTTRKIKLLDSPPRLKITFLCFFTVWFDCSYCKSLLPCQQILLNWGFYQNVNSIRVQILLKSGF